MKLITSKSHSLIYQAIFSYHVSLINAVEMMSKIFCQEIHHWLCSYSTTWFFKKHTPALFTILPHTSQTNQGLSWPWLCPMVSSSTEHLYWTVRFETCPSFTGPPNSHPQIRVEKVDSGVLIFNQGRGSPKDCAWNRVCPFIC